MLRDDIQEEAKIWVMERGSTTVKVVSMRFDAEPEGVFERTYFPLGHFTLVYSSKIKA